jgi:general secretion pathway protein G
LESDAVKVARPTLWGAHDRRRRFLVNRLQTKYVVVQLCWAAAIVTLFAGLVFGPTVYELFAGTADQQRRAADLFLDLHTRLWPALIALAAALAVLIVLQSHRVIGPLVRFKGVFEAVTRGELWVHSQIRATDYPQDEGRALNAMLASLRERIGDAQTAAMSLEAALEQPTPGGTDEVRAALNGLQRPLTAYEVFRPLAGTPAPESPIRPLPPADVGFTLIEMLLVASLISVLAVIAVPGYLAALERARVTRAIGDIRGIQSEIQTYWLASGCYPATLVDVGFGTKRDPWGSPYSYGVLEAAPGGGGMGKGGGGAGTCAACSGACLGRGAARKDRNLVPINSDFDFYSMGRDRQSVGPLAAQASQDDIVRASDGGFIGLGREY